ncbi:MAG TPA: hypothetical protein VGV59_01700 [Pyrinomonadaceae bacterium]|nr:hypothetical protein [Pyrinomonadaceae bacterium]
MAERFVNLLKQRHGFDEWRGRNTLDENLFIWKFFLMGRELPGWRPERVERFDAPQTYAPRVADTADDRPATHTPPLVIRTSRHPLTRPEDTVHRVRRIDPHRPATSQPPASAEDVSQERPSLIQSFWSDPRSRTGALLDVSIHECSSREAAHELLLRLLAQFQSPLITRRDDAGIGDVTFADPYGTTVLFARANLVQVVRNAGRSVAPVHEPAGYFDAGLTSKPAPTPQAESGAAPRLARVRFEETHVRVGVPVPFDVEATDMLGADIATPFAARTTAALREDQAPPARPLMFKIFSKPTGQVLAARGNLLFRADEAGSQEVTVYAIDANAAAASKRVRLVAE